MTKPRPTILRASEVRDLLDKGEATVVRPVKPQPSPGIPHVYLKEGLWDGKEAPSEGFATRNPFGAPGAELWVRETWGAAHPIQIVGRQHSVATDGIPGPPPVKYRTIYRADGELPVVYYAKDYPYRSTTPGEKYPQNEPCPMEWRSPVTMPRWASRLVVRVEDVRVEQVDGVWHWVVKVKRIEP